MYSGPEIIDRGNCKKEGDENGQKTLSAKSKKTVNELVSSQSNSGT